MYIYISIYSYIRLEAIASRLEAIATVGWRPLLLETKNTSGKTQNICIYIPKRPCEDDFQYEPLPVGISILRFLRRLTPHLSTLEGF